MLACSEKMRSCYGVDTNFQFVTGMHHRLATLINVRKSRYARQVNQFLWENYVEICNRYSNLLFINEFLEIHFHNPIPWTSLKTVVKLWVRSHIFTRCVSSRPARLWLFATSYPLQLIIFIVFLQSDQILVLLTICRSS